MNRQIAYLYTFILFSVQHYCYASQPQTTNTVDYDKAMYEWLKPLTESFHLVHTKHYLNVDPSKAMSNAISAFIKTLDPHSSFLDKKAYEDIIRTTKGELCGIGIIVDYTKEPDDEFLRIIDTVPAGPADSAGLEPDDKIIEVDGESVKGLSLDDTISKIQGKRNTPVTIKAQRTGNTSFLTFTITRDIIKEPNAICYYLKDHNVYYLCLTMFTENSVNQVEQLLKKIQQHQSKGLILDLRNNSGGLLNAVVDIAGLFLEKNSLVVVTKGRDNKELERYSTTKDPVIAYQAPLFILVNQFTASAAEILAGCLQLYSDHSSNSKVPLVFIVGTKTFGKGSVQEVIPVSNDCALKLTTAIYHLPYDVSIQGKGVIPDFEIEPKVALSPEIKWFNATFGKENILRNTIQIDEKKKKQKDTEKDEKKQSWHEKKRDLIATDYQLLSTVRLLEMLDLLQKVQGSSIKTRSKAIPLLKSLYSPQDKLDIEEIKI